MRETYTLLALSWSCCVMLAAEGFLAPRARLPATTGRGGRSMRRCRTPLLAVTPPGKSSGGGGGAGSAAAGGDENGAGFGAEDKRITRAPLRITPNFQPQEKRRPKADAQEDATYGAFLTEESFDIAAMAWAEFSDWLRRTIERNVDGAQFEFDVRQWSSSIRKWWSRAVEMDVQAKAELFRLYDRGMLERDAWGNQAVKVDARVEDEWDSIYVDCQDCVDSTGGSGASILRGSAEPRGARTAAGDAAEGERLLSLLAMDESSVSRMGDEGREGAERGGEESVLSALAAYGMYEVDGDRREGVSSEEEEEEEEGGEDDGGDSEGFDEEDIIDCAIRGRWTFENSDDPPYFSPQ